MKSRHPRRNAAIVRKYRKGATMTALAREYGLSLSRIHHIIKNLGAQLSPEERRARHSAHSREIAARPEVRAKIAATIRRRWAEGRQIGRRRILADDPARREDYLNLRGVYGAAKAREMMGLENAA